MTSTSICDLPNEILSIVFSFTTKKSLKDVRQTCKLFSALTTPYLFDQVFIGPSRFTLGIFQHIVHHPTLSKHVKTLVYDTASFKSISDMDGYYRGFQRFCHYTVRKNAPIDKKEASSVRELERCIVLLYGGISTGTIKDVDYSFSDSLIAKAAEVMSAGLERWKRERNQQLYYAKTGDMRSLLMLAVCKFPNLLVLRLQGSWQCTYAHREGEKDLPLLPFFPTSGPLARSWGEWHVPPGASKDRTGEGQAIQDIISTFSLSSKCARTWNVTRLILKVHVSVFEPQSDWIMTGEHWDTVMAKLTYLVVHVHTLSTDRLGPHFLDLATFAKASRLRRFAIIAERLWSTKDSTDYRDYCPIGLRDPAHTFPNLEFLALKGLRATAKNFLDFVAAQPKLLQLELGALCFMDAVGNVAGDDANNPTGLWTLIEGIFRLQNLKFRKLAPPLLDGRTGELVSRKEWKTDGCDRKIKNFVESRGLGHICRNASLRTGLTELRQCNHDAHKLHVRGVQ
ncbi:MAG: hypothetical protein LQ338_005964 [Usnochroma carphineum]|nr:MAG: hypothetical protein LQ338_005964 [Usnochroma carphineum]